MMVITTDDALVLVKQWKRTKDPMVLEELYKIHANFIAASVNKYMDAPVPKSVLEAEAKKYLMDAYETYDATKGASLATYVFSNLRRLRRYVIKFQNVARIPEHRALSIASFNFSKAQLGSQLNRDPVALELADHLGWPVQRVINMETQLRKDIVSPLDTERSAKSFDENMEVINFAYFSFSNEEKLIYDYLTGKNGKPRLTIKQIAGKLKKKPSEIRKMKNKMAYIIESHLK